MGGTGAELHEEDILMHDGEEETPGKLGTHVKHSHRKLNDTRQTVTETVGCLLTLVVRHQNVTNFTIIKNYSQTTTGGSNSHHPPFVSSCNR